MGCAGLLSSGAPLDFMTCCCSWRFYAGLSVHPPDFQRILHFKTSQDVVSAGLAGCLLREVAAIDFVREMTYDNIDIGVARLASP